MAMAAPNVNAAPVFPVGGNAPISPPGIFDHPTADHIRRRRQFTQLSQFVGTGGTVVGEGSYVVTFASGEITVVHVDKSAQNTAALMLREIKAMLVPQIKDLALVLQVQRQSIYTWLKGGKVTPAHLARIKAVYKLASHAKMQFAGIERKRVEEALIASSITALLCQETIPQRQVESKVNAVGAELKHLIAQRPMRKQVDLLATARQVSGPGRLDAGSATQRQILTGKGYVFEADE